MAAFGRSPRAAFLLAGGLVAACLITALAAPPTPALAPPAAPSYGDASAWLCRPGRADVCAAPTTATIVQADGRQQRVTYRADPHAPIDCFYVYPTVSHAPGDNAPIAATDDETGAAQKQLARFASVCRPFAPLYRQVTRHGLGKLIGNPDPNLALRRLAYGDVRAAWHAYLAEDNRGRGVVLIGHSQGAEILARLMAEEIDGKPLQARLVAAIIPGTEVDVPAGSGVGGIFKHIPLCAHAMQTGCVIAYSTFPAGGAIPAGGIFGVARTPGMIDACVDPAALAGQATLAADLPLWGELRQRFGTDFLELPGAVAAACVREGAFSILAITATTDRRVGEPILALLDAIAEPTPASGFHALDINLAEGTLVDIVRRQAAAYARK